MTTNATLSSYTTACQRLLHDSNFNFYSPQELTDYINEARLRCVRDTGSLRTIVQVTVVPAQETYSYATYLTPLLPSNGTAIDVLNINVIWGNSRLMLDYLPFSRYNYWLRGWALLQGRPIVFSVYGQNTIYMGPSPDQAYVTEWDVVYTPFTMVSGTDAEVIPIPFQSPIPFYACYLAKQRMQEWEEADRFMEVYKRQVISALNSAQTRRLTRVI